MTVPPEALAAAFEACPFVNRDAATRLLEAAGPWFAAAERDRIRQETDEAIAELRDAGDERGALWLEAFRIGLLRDAS